MPRPGTVFFGGLPTSFDKKDIEQLVSGYGPYDDVDFKPRPHFNFAFVDFCNRRDAEYVIKELHGTYIQPGYKITVEFSQGRGYKPRDPPYRRYRSRTPPPRSPRTYDRYRSPPRGNSLYGRGGSRSPGPRYGRRHCSPGPRGGSRTPSRHSRRARSRGRSPSRSPRARSGSRERWRRSATPPRQRGTGGRSRRSPDRSPTPGTPRGRRFSVSPPGARSPVRRGRSRSPRRTSLRPESVSRSPPPRSGRSVGRYSGQRASHSPGERAGKAEFGSRGPSPVPNATGALNGNHRETFDAETEAENGHQWKS